MSAEIEERYPALFFRRLISARAKRKAARQFGVDYRYRPKDLPSNREIRDQVQILAALHEGDFSAEYATRYAHIDTRVSV